MNPHNAEVLNNLGLCFLNINDNDKAVNFLMEAVKEDNDNERALNNLGNALRKCN
jgi:Flp pilus assembly protein TadD